MLAVVQNAMSKICDEMDIVLERTAFNPVMSEARDRANGIYDKSSGEVIAQGATGLPIFVGVMQDAVKSVLREFPELRDGDVVVLNDPFCGGTHLMDVKLVRPFFYKGRRFATLANAGHWTDIGGSVPGGFNVRATSILAEGLRIPPVMLMSQGEMREDIVRILLSNMRVPEERLGDLKAQLAALNVGARRLTELLDKYGAEWIEKHVKELRERSTRLMRAYIRQIANGTYSFDTFLDSDGIVLEPIRVALDLTVRDEELLFDFSRSSPPVRGPLNAAISATNTAVFIGLKHIFPEVPINGGIFEPVTVHAPETTFLNAKYPKAVSGSSAEVTLRVVDAVFGAMAQAVPDRVPAASFGSVANFTIGGYDPESAKDYIMFRFSGGGYGGQAGCDGLSNGSPPISAARTAQVEVIEQLYPVMFDYYRLRNSSCGAGLFRGGCGMEFQIRLLHGEASGSVLGDRGRFPPFGLQGGKDAQLAQVEFNLSGRAYFPEHVTKDEGIMLVPGDTARIATAGGGGWGNAFERSAEKVLQDVKYELINASEAERDYGVIVVAGDDGDWAIAEEATRELRARMRPRDPAMGSTEGLVDMEQVRR
jgi:N-methylhydantoinase B